MRTSQPASLVGGCPTLAPDSAAPDSADIGGSMEVRGRPGRDDTCCFFSNTPTPPPQPAVGPVPLVSSVR